MCLSVILDGRYIRMLKSGIFARIHFRDTPRCVAHDPIALCREIGSYCKDGVPHPVGARGEGKGGGPQSSVEPYAV